jgi:hypothetical protein
VTGARPAVLGRAAAPAIRAGAARALRAAPALLVGGCVLAGAGTLAVLRARGTPVVVDAELARLLRAMALIKAGLVVVGAGVLAWRLQRPVPPLTGVAYVVGAWVASGAVAAMWSFTALAAVAAVLHGVAAALLVLAWRDPEFVPLGGSTGET